MQAHVHLKNAFPGWIGNRRIRFGYNLWFASHPSSGPKWAESWKPNINAWLFLLLSCLLHSPLHPSASNCWRYVHSSGTLTGTGMHLEFSWIVKIIIFVKKNTSVAYFTRFSDPPSQKAIYLNEIPPNLIARNFTLNCTTQVSSIGRLLFYQPVDQSRSISTVDKDSPIWEYGHYRRLIRIRLSENMVDIDSR